MENKKEKLQDRYKIFKYASPTTILLIFIGIAGGYLYYHFVGCASGGCPITSNPWLTMLWGGILGYLIGDSIKPKHKEQKKEEQ